MNINVVETEEENIIHLPVIAAELERQGFVTYITDNAVKVALRNRQVSKSEVQDALEQVFEEIVFDFVSFGGCVYVYP